MKKILLTIVAVFFWFALFAQSPEKVNYQAVARDLAGSPLINTTVNLTFDVLQGSGSGAVAYSETQVKTTNQFGLFTAEIGAGTVASGNFPGIAWGSNTYFLRISVNGDVMPATQLLSVPYALHAKTAASGVPGADGVNCWDTNGNGINDPSEDVNSDSFFNALDCQGVSGLAGVNGNDNLSLVTPEPAGANCANGGVKVDVGVDDDANGSLQPAEIDFTYYVCNGLDAVANSSDTSATNELQTLSIVNDTIFLTNGGFVKLPVSNPGVWNSNGQGIDYAAGNVGVGVANPSAKLDVETTIAENSLLAAQIVNNNNGNSDFRGLYVLSSSSGSASEFVGGDFQSFGFGSGTTSIAIRGEASGGVNNWAGYFGSGNVYIQNNLGLGTTSPAAKFHLDGTLRLENIGGVNANGNVLTTDGAGNATWQSPTSGIDVDGDGWPSTMDLDDSNPSITFYDADSSSTNELQNLGWSNADSNVINISNGTGVSLAANTPIANQVLTWNGGNWVAQNPGAGADNWGSQLVNVDGVTINGDGDTTPLSGFDGQYSSLSGSPTNVSTFTNDAGYLIPPSPSTGEYLFWDGSQWVGSVPSSGTDNQDLSLSGNTLSLTNDPSSVDLTPFMDNTDAQNLTSTISGSTATIGISGGSSTTFSINDADFDATNEIQTLSFSSPNLTLSSGGSVDLSSLITNDGDWTISANNMSSAVTGNVGIGLANPVNKLHIHEPSAVATNMSLTNTATGTAGTDGFVIAAGNTGRALLMNREATEMLFYTSNTVRMGIDAAGEVGIGTINPSSDLHIYKSSGAGTIMLESPVAGNLQYGIKNTNTEYALELNGINFHIQQAGSNLMTFSGGDVGIGMTPSNSQLDVNGQITMQDGNQSTGYIPVSDVNGTMTWTDPSSLSSSFWQGVTASSDIYFSSGRVGIGTNTPNFNLEVNNISTDRGAYVVTSGRTSNSYKIGVTGIAQNGSGSGSNVGGVFNAINGTGGDNIAVEAFAQNGAANIYGLRSLATTNTNSGTSYGVYSSATGAATNWAGYFDDGNVYVHNSVSIGTETTRFVAGANNTLVVATSNTASQSYSSIELKSYSAAQNAPGSEINFIREHSGSNNYHLGRITTRSYGAADEGVLLLGVSNGANNILDRISIDNSGQVGIGSQSYTSLNAQLHVTNNESTADGEAGVFTYIQNMASTFASGSNGIISGMRFGLTNYSSDNYYKAGILFESNGSANGLGDMHFAVNGAADNTNAGVSNAAMTISSIGNIGIGTPSPNSKLHVNETSTNPGLRVQINGTTQFIVANNGNVALNNNAAPSYKLHLASNSAAKPTSNVWTVASDARLKKDVKPFEGGLDDILKINPVWFTYNGKAGMPKDKGVGVLAQDLQKVAPYMINKWTYTEGSMDENNPRTDGEKTEYFGVDNGAMTYMLINAVKEQQNMIEQLKKEIEELKKK